jgi:hypothetical protein
MLYLQHYKAAGFAFLSAVLSPCLGNFLNSSLASIILVILLAVSVTLFVAWYLLKGHPEIINDGLTKLESEKRQILARADALRESAELEAKKLLANRPSTP